MKTTLRILRAAILLLSGAIAAAPAALAQCPPKTIVSDTLFNADGSLAAGRVVIAWPTFLAGSCQVVAGQATVTFANGQLSVELYPNDAATPAGTSYRVTYYLKSGRVSTEYWVVPANGSPIPLATVRSASVPSPAVMFGQAQVTNLIGDLARKVELPSPCAAGKFLQANGAATPPQVSCVDGTGAGSQHQVNGVPLAANDPVNLQDSATIALANPSAGNIQAAVKDAAITAAKLAVSNPTSAQLAGVGNNNIAASALSPDRISGVAVVGARAINTSAPLAGGGDLTADRTLSCPTCEVTANKGAASGYASLDASSRVAQDPASASSTPAAGKIPVADGSGKLADAWLSSNASLLGQSIGTGEIENNAVTRDKVSVVLRTRQIIFLLGADNGSTLVDADDQSTIWYNSLGSGITLIGVWCESDAGTSRIQLQRDDGSPANILTDSGGAGLDCSTSGASGTLDATEKLLSSGHKLDFVMVTAGGSAKRVAVVITFTLD
jgi:hypothetical protein